MLDEHRTATPALANFSPRERKPDGRCGAGKRHASRWLVACTQVAGGWGFVVAVAPPSVSPQADTDPVHGGHPPMSVAAGCREAGLVHTRTPGPALM